MAYCYSCRKKGKVGKKRLYQCKSCKKKMPSMKQVKKSCYRKCLSGMKRKGQNTESFAAKAECKEKCRRRRKKR